MTSSVHTAQIVKRNSTGTIGIVPITTSTYDLLAKVLLDKWSGNVTLNIKDGEIRSAHVEEVVVLR